MTAAATTAAIFIARVADDGSPAEHYGSIPLDPHQQQCIQCTLLAIGHYLCEVRGNDDCILGATTDENGNTCFIIEAVKDGVSFSAVAYSFKGTVQ